MKALLLLLLMASCGKDSGKSSTEAKSNNSRSGSETVVQVMCDSSSDCKERCKNQASYDVKQCSDAATTNRSKQICQDQYSRYENECRASECGYMCRSVLPFSSEDDINKCTWSCAEKT